MQFQKLKLTGFKSFVEPTEFRIEPGLTGVVGPNGCGKSNLLEALRWVMGANSAKAMRAEGMDDVIFGGTSGRPARNHAEVQLVIDNSARRAPPQFNAHDVLEVSRRIDRGAGSLYRINGAEARARDVQLLFADASTGANSPALVRQGQISELIAAKPSNRRRILEEAAGVSGLHTRRHDADLRLKAAEANLARLDDVVGELETALNRLKREARQAERYKRLSAEIRGLQGASLHARWTEAIAAKTRAEGELAAALAAVETAAREAARAEAEALTAAKALNPLREEAMVAAAVLQRAILEKDRLERDETEASAALQRARTEAQRIAADRAREGELAADAAESRSRLERDLAELERQIAAAPERTPELQAAIAAAELARAEADRAVEMLAAEAAADAAARQASRGALDSAEAAARAAAQRRQDAEARLARTRRALDQARADRARIALADPAAALALAALAEAEARLAEAKRALAEAEQARQSAQAQEIETRDAARSLADRLASLKAEAQGLAALLKPAQGGKAWPPVLDQVQVEAGYEKALAAALGEDLSAALDARAPTHWSALDRAGASLAWPEGCQPLAAHVQAPAALAHRLALVAVVEAGEGARLAARLPVGARLVSKAGDLWRWDGFVARADAPRPAAQRLVQRNRVSALETEMRALAPDAEAAAAAHRRAADQVRAAEDALRLARRAPEPAERAVAEARAGVERHAREAARREAQAQALDETISRFEVEAEEAQVLAEGAMREAEAAAAGVAELRARIAEGPGRDFGPALAEARRRAGQAREAEAAARAALEAERRAREGRARRRESLTRELADWRRRAEAAARREAELEAEAARAAAAVAAAEAGPAALSARRTRLLDELGLAEARQARASDAVQAAEAALQAADRSSRAAAQAAGDAREARAAAEARLEAAREKAEAAAEQIRQTLRLEPEALGRRLAEEAIAAPPDPDALDAHLARLERERDQLGAVNLRAEEEAQEHARRLESLLGERADLTGAIAKLRAGISELNEEGRDRLLAAFTQINESFQVLFQTLFAGGQAELRLVESDDPLEAGLEIYACPPGKRLSVMSLMSGGEQALTATALIFAVFLANPAPVCVLDEVDAPLDDANVDRFCRMLDDMRTRTQTRFIAITHNPVTMSRMDRLYGVTMAERGVSQLVSVDLRQAEALAAE